MMGVGQARRGVRPRLADSVLAIRHGLLGIGLLSGLVNLLLLGIALYIIVMFDTVQPARSLATLVSLFLMVFASIVFYGLFCAIRSRLVLDMAAAVHRHMSASMPGAITYIAMNGGGSGDGLQPLDDLEDIRTFLSGPGPIALLDLPWILLAMLLLFVVHFWLGALALVAIVVMAGLCLAMERSAGTRLQWLADARSYRRLIADEQRSHAEAIAVLGMGSRFGYRWAAFERRVLTAQQEQDRLAGTMDLAAGALRLLFLASALAVGVWLTFDDRATVGVIVGSAILLYQTLAPVDRALAHWPSFAGARRAWQRLDQLLPMLAVPSVSTTLPRPTEQLEVAQLAVAAPGRPYPIVQGIGFRLRAGEALGIVGPSGAGKTVLLRALIGLWRPSHGAIRLDGATLEQWNPELLGAHIGYLPQNIELLNGTVAQNIARFDPDATSEEIIAAATAAGVHDMILRLPDGYDSKVGRDGGMMAPGQRQRIALARALFRDPFLVILDDPNSNLDDDGDAALLAAIAAIRARNGVAIIVAYRHDVFEHVDHIMVMRNGAMAAFGPRERMLQRLLGNAGSSPPQGNSVSIGNDPSNPG
jgi:PrtD family type I secretion system ABC transporter